MELLIIIAVALIALAYWTYLLIVLCDIRAASRATLAVLRRIEKAAQTQTDKTRR